MVVGKIPISWQLGLAKPGDCRDTWANRAWCLHELSQNSQATQGIYIPGFDPFPPRRYRELYRSEAKKQADFGGYNISQEILEVEDGFGWRVTGQIDDVTCVSDIEVVVWSDIVKSTMSGGILSTYLHMIRTAWIYLSTGTLWDIVQLRKGPVIAALYPIGFLCLQFLLALGVVWALQFILSPILGWGSYVAFAGIWPILSAFRQWDGKIFAYYLMQDY